MTTPRLQLVIPWHQPLTAGPEELDQACARCYLPFLSALEAHDGVRVALHLGGHLLDHCSRRQEELLARVRELSRAGRVEVLGGLFYGGPPALLPELDVRGQIQMTAEYWESFLGAAPAGFWLPELAWTPELPRLLDETGLRYGFVSSSQLVGAGATPPALGWIERGGLGIAAFVLHAGLSCALPGVTVEEWMKNLSEAALARPREPLSVWVRAESFGLEPGTERWCHAEGWLAAWLDALNGDVVETVLPATSFAGGRATAALKVRPTIATELGPLGRAAGAVEWVDGPSQYVELDTLYRRMLRTSEKLRLAIANMEEEGLEDDWSDALATAQRLVFAAQAPDGYWRGQTPGFSEPALRDAITSRLLEAEGMLDVLVQGEEDWIALEEEDRDNDLADEAFVANRLLSAWIVPDCGGRVRTLEDRSTRHNLLDVGGRRDEAFFADMAAAPLQAEAGGPPRRGQGLSRQSDRLPTVADNVERVGIRELLLEPDATPSELFSGSLLGVEATRDRLEITENRIDEEGDASYRLRLTARLDLDGVRPRSATVEKCVCVPIDAAELSIEYGVTLTGEGGAILAVELPLRLGGPGARLLVNDAPHDLAEGAVHEVSRLCLERDGGERLTVTLEPALEVWLLPVRTTVRDLDGYRIADQGLVAVPVIRIEQQAQARLNLRLGE